MYDAILVPIDGSEPSDAAVDHTSNIARQCESEVHVLTVVELPPRPESVEAVSEPVIEDRKEAGRNLVDEAADRLEEAGIDAVESLTEGTPVDRITEYARSHEIDLIVMGTHGRSGFDRILLGSTTERTLRSADRPVLIVGSEP